MPDVVTVLLQHPARHQFQPTEACYFVQRPHSLPGVLSNGTLSAAVAVLGIPRPSSDHGGTPKRMHGRGERWGAEKRPSCNLLCISKIQWCLGGEGGIRTHGARKGSTVFETARFNHSRTSPRLASTHYTVPDPTALRERDGRRAISDEAAPPQFQRIVPRKTLPNMDCPPATPPPAQGRAG